MAENLHDLPSIHVSVEHPKSRAAQKLKFPVKSILYKPLENGDDSFLVFLTPDSNSWVSMGDSHTGTIVIEVELFPNKTGDVSRKGEAFYSQRNLKGARDDWERHVNELQYDVLYEISDSGFKRLYVAVRQMIRAFYQDGEDDVDVSVAR